MSLFNTTKSALQKSSTNANSQSLPRLINTCAGCLNELSPSKDEEYVVALGQEWHDDCFRCSVCDHHLHNWYFEKNGLLFCRDDYYQRFGEACQQCSDVISGPVMVAGDHKFHPECFCCTQCSSFIGYGEAFALLERSKLYCDGCYKTVLTTETNSTVDGIIKPLHSIRLVEIPKDITTSLRLSVDSIDGSQRSTNGGGGLHLSGDNWNLNNNASSSSTSHLDFMSGKGLLAGSSNDLCPAIRISEIDVNLTNLHVGDRILEVNGTPISDNSIEQIDKMIRSTEILQLTVEHDPIQVCRSCSHVDIKKVTSEISLPLATSASSVEVFGRTYDSGGTVTTTTTQPHETSPTRLTKQDKERIYKRKDEGYISGTKTRQLRKCKNLNIMAAQDLAGKVACLNNNNKNQDKSNASTSLSFRGKERCSSMSKLMGDQHTAQNEQMYDLTRTTSFRVEQKPQRVFRPSDLVIGELLGKGFFGQVFKVTHRITKEVMVLKELHRVEETAQLNFLKEVAVLKSLSHKNVLKFIGVLYKEKRLHLVTEYVAGGSLKELLHDSGLPLTWPERISFAKDIACGMSYLHSKNIIHRDLNSLNCLVKEDKTIIVADFGLARIINTSLSSRCSDKWNSSERSNSQEGNHNQVNPNELESGNSNNNNNNGTWGRSKSRQRRQRYTVVGNPYWMAPEMMKGFIYDEKVDVFSFGIVLCEIIGRVQADPDFLPRTHDFGLNQKVFREKFCYQCPEAFCKITFLCCDLNPDRRPSFEILEVWLDSLQTHIASNQPVPQELLYDIENYQGGSISSTPVDILTPKSNLSRDNLDELCNSNHSLARSGIVVDIEEKKMAMDSEERDEKLDYYSALPDGIPKSPHLGKDFSPSGERIHNSMRARRRQRFLQAQNASHQNEEDCTDQVLQAVKDSLQQQDSNRTSRRKVDRGFVLDISRSGVLNINNVRDLNNLSDFDSSCDTSLNYHEVNPVEESPANDSTLNASEMKDITLKTIQESDDHLDSEQFKNYKQIENANNNHLSSATNDVQKEEESQAIDSMHNVKRNLAEKSYKSALEDIRIRLNLCKSKFDTIDEANRKNYNNSQNSMRSLFKVQNSNDVYKSSPESFKMFDTLKSSNTSDTDTESVRKTYRVNQTPVFGRKSQAASKEIYKPHSDSLENLDKISLSVEHKNDKKDSSPPKKAKLPKERTFKSYITSVEVTPSESVQEQVPLKKENSSGKLKVSTNLLGLRKSLNFNSPLTRNEETKPFSRRTLSPTKSSEAKRVVKQEIPTTSRLRNVATSPSKPFTSSSTNTTRLTILSPERIHRLSAKLSDQKKNLSKTPPTVMTKTSLDNKNLQNSNTPQTTNHSMRGTTETERSKRNAISRSQFYTRY